MKVRIFISHNEITFICDKCDAHLKEIDDLLFHPNGYKCKYAARSFRDPFQDLQLQEVDLNGDPVQFGPSALHKEIDGEPNRSE